ncbi:uncharacterized protein LOC129310598 [Prosopis cineraria]|uniref:uncharacterized protein LOC129310598 n=1 Tax=Prosopis cineraria TaxID=364024 RepID=UPI00241069E4|nr:uncharacterized protein LOC129310598 [Prosopis cineraria]
MGTTRTIIPRWTYSHGGFVSLEERVSDASVRVLNLHQSLLQTTSADVISEYLSKISSTFLVTDKQISSFEKSSEIVVLDYFARKEAGEKQSVGVGTGQHFGKPLATQLHEFMACEQSKEDIYLHDFPVICAQKMTRQGCHVSKSTRSTRHCTCYKVSRPPKMQKSYTFFIFFLINILHTTPLLFCNDSCTLLKTNLLLNKNGSFQGSRLFLH